MQSFDFPDPNPPKAEPPKKQQRPAPQPVSNKPFGFYGKNSTSKNITLSKQQQLQKEKELQEFKKLTMNQMPGFQIQQASIVQKLGHKASSSNEAHIKSALKKANNPQSALQMVQVVRNDQAERQVPIGVRPASALPASLKGAPCVPVKQMVYFNSGDDTSKAEQAINAATQINEESLIGTPSIMPNNKQVKRPQTAKPKNMLGGNIKTTQAYTSQNHYEEDFEKARKPKEDFTIAGRKMDPVKLEPDEIFQMNNRVREGAVGGGRIVNYRVGGQQAVAMPHTLSSKFNAERFYKNHHKRLKDHDQENNDAVNIFKGKQLQRPQSEKKLSKSKPYKAPEGRQLNHEGLQKLSKYQDMKAEQGKKKLKEEMFTHNTNILQYNRDNEAFEKREQNKKEMKEMLEHYMQGSSVNQELVRKMKEAQGNIKDLHKAMDKANLELEAYQATVNQEEERAMEMRHQLGNKTFKLPSNLGLLEKNLDRLRIDYAGADKVNNKIAFYEQFFDDPARLPHYDARGGYWKMSSQFEVQEAKHHTPVVIPHPFLDKEFI